MMFGIKKLREEIGKCHDQIPNGGLWYARSLWANINFLSDTLRKTSGAVSALEKQIRYGLTDGEITALRALLKEKYDCTTCWDKGGEVKYWFAIDAGTGKPVPPEYKHCPDCGRPHNHKKGAK